MATRRRGAARPVESGVDPVHLHEVLPPQGAFVGHLTITRVFLAPRMPMRDSGVAAPTDVGVAWSDARTTLKECRHAKCCRDAATRS
jgi:hypothetical protein